VVPASYIFLLQSGNVFCRFVLFPICLTDQQNDLNAATLTVRHPLDSFMNSSRKKGSASWRHSLFNPPSNGGIFGAGVLNMSPGWFQQSQDVRLVANLPLFLFAVLFYYGLLYLVSATFRIVICLFGHQE
jgi:hypothetical protein